MDRVVIERERGGAQEGGGREREININKHCIVNYTSNGIHYGKDEYIPTENRVPDIYTFQNISCMEVHVLSCINVHEMCLPFIIHH